MSYGYLSFNEMYPHNSGLNLLWITCEVWLQSFVKQMKDYVTGFAELEPPGSEFGEPKKI